MLDPLSPALPGMMFTKPVLGRPAEPITVPLLRGKSPDVMAWLAENTPGALARGCNWFCVRTSEPACQWQEAQACRPSPPTCMSQNNALPSLMAAALSETKLPRLAGRGMGTPLSDLAPD